MIPFFICAFSFVLLLQFFFSYCHSLIAESRRYELSSQVCEVAHIQVRATHGDEFKRLLQLIAVCPASGGDRNQLGAVSVYYDLLGLARGLIGWVVPVARWIESERCGCSYLAAVLLDRRITRSRILMAQQMGTNF
jgi:hypothetical protein